MLASLSLGSTRLQRNLGQQERQRFWDPPTQPGTVSRKGGITIHGKEVFSARFWLVSGSLDVLGFPHSVRQDLSQTGDFYTASIMVGVRASLTLCVCFCVLFPHVHEWHLGDGS